MRILHTAVWVSDWVATRAFYVDGLGLAVRMHAEIDGVDNYLVAGDGTAAIQFKHQPGGEQSVTPAGIDHLAVAVQDVDGVYERLVVDIGSPSRKEPFVQSETGNRIAFVEDPDGYLVELVDADAMET